MDLLVEWLASVKQAEFHAADIIIHPIDWSRISNQRRRGRKLKARELKPCGWCSALMPVTPRMAGIRKYCSRECAVAAVAEGNRRVPKGICPGCGKEFFRRYSGGQRMVHCSRRCAETDRKRRTELRRLVKAEIAALRKIGIGSFRCPTCHRAVHQRNGRRYCSIRCRETAQVWVPAIRSCVECGADFSQTKRWQRTCGEACLVAIEKRHRRKARARRRARERGSFADLIDPISVFQRDRWKCQLCGRKTPARLRATCAPNAPELDHIVTLAEGGAHAWDNVQCACRNCNQIKGAISRGQLHLNIY